MGTSARLQRGVSAGQNRQQGATAACQGARSGVAQSQPHAKPQHESAEPIPSLMVFRPIANAGSAITGFASRRSIVAVGALLVARRLHVELVSTSNMSCLRR